MHPLNDGVVGLRISNLLHLSTGEDLGAGDRKTWTKYLLVELHSVYTGERISKLLSKLSMPSKQAFVIFRDELSSLMGGRIPDVSEVILRPSLMPPWSVTGNDALDVVPDFKLPQQCQGSTRKVPLTCDPALLARWVSKCEECHGNRCADSTFARTPGLRLLDVHTMRLMQPEASAAVRYVALSYVWGEHPFMSLRIANLTEILRTGFVVDNKLHPAIKDSIQILRGMNQRYLWVDALCIVQDCETDKSVQIAQMGSIYSNAVFTIIAAPARNSDDLGLPGVSIHAPRPQGRVFSQKQHLPIGRGQLASWLGR
ncbi:heterokaryon incompatibility protein-domain-containing protein [Exophiala viscosa]|uniref:Heterokaryon incompatibility protein-domain-containing protein n=1 Tax=Exophiala viscosa TaxID=2486360 RepID=A0AAN6DNJ9_9EURO|nr:heterokaryon incompatibility protein-domain-containing protein [Exophiala viscosa]